MPRNTVSGRVAASGRVVPTKSRELIGNLVFNGDFEYAPAFTAATNTALRWIDGTAAGSTTNRQYGWFLFDRWSVNENVRFDTSVSRTGTTSLKLSVNTIGGSIQVFNQNTPFRAIPVSPSTAYTLTYWIKTNRTSGGGTGAYIAISERDGSGGFLADTLGTAVNTTQDWTQITVSKTTGVNTRFVMLKLTNFGTGGAANLIMDAWFDDVMLTRDTPITRQNL